MRYLLLIALAACTTTTAAPTEPKKESTPAPENLVCTRWKKGNPKAECASERIDVGEHHLHSAVITIPGEGSTACSINDQMNTVECSDLIMIHLPQSQVKTETPKK